MRNLNLSSLLATRLVTIPNRIAWLALCLSIGLAPRAAAQLGSMMELSHLRETIPLDLSHDNRTWIVGHSQRAEDGEILELVLEGETVEDWSELITVNKRPLATEGGKRRQSKQLDELLRLMKQQLASGCPTLQWSEQKRSGTDRIVAWSHKGCSGFPAQQVLVRHLLTQGSLLSIQYAAKREEPLATKVADRWLSMLRSAKLQKDPEPDVHRMRIELADGEIGELSFRNGEPIPTETSTARIEVVGLAAEKLLFAQGTGLIEVVSVQIKAGPKPISIQVDDVTDTPVRLLVNDQEPHYEAGRWNGKTAPVPVTPVDAPWLFEPGPWNRVLRFRLSYEQGPDQLLYQARFIPESFKEIARRSFMGGQ